MQPAAAVRMPEVGKRTKRKKERWKKRRPSGAQDEINCNVREGRLYPMEGLDKRERAYQYVRDLEKWIVANQ